MCPNPALCRGLWSHKCNPECVRWRSIQTRTGEKHLSIWKSQSVIFALYTTDKSVSWNWEFSRYKFKLISCLYIPPVEVKGEVFLLVLFVDELGQPCRGSRHAHPAPDGGVHSDLHHCCWWVATRCVEMGAYVLVLLLLHMYKFTNWNLDIWVTRH